MKLNKNKIGFILAERNMIQQDLANASGMSRGNLSCVINGKGCRPSTVYKIAKALEVNPEDIIEEVIR